MSAAVQFQIFKTKNTMLNGVWKVFRIGTVRYNWPMSAHASQAFSIAHIPIRKICHGVIMP